ncbi:hypothetical protein [Lepagella muris]|jgi:hypothetical protein|uniref:Uncharacterized protein n=2 Tax=Muribaculaceae TaxID=2005473 RepID=A0AC61RMQ6_9BACT|nr:hypothetical protein [Lepagella muris]ROT06251.1 hypothetical protein EEL33_09810 [Muribaculaceae bacterium Isolate-037 (Harlan)]TGY80314.1 hypothetical protein E5331_03505 [Lepagella muris]THG52853.1 hypothetical protein E5984_05985 [Bacteroidales bacterium]TKC58697.1 hypothetical protein E5359_010045 [Bacteroidales bacterium]
MKFWNYIGEFLLFRWLFDKRNRNNNIGNAHSVDASRYSDWSYAEGDNFSPVDYLHTVGPSYRGADIYDEEDDALDDYDPTDSDDYQSDGSTKTYGHYSDYGYSQSYDDFHEEQDNYDMIDDDF